ncbi:MAG: hypothetical protein RIS64_4145 [Bacteroidota bacterium]|jgi:hypothetical protein
MKSKSTSVLKSLLRQGFLYNRYPAAIILVKNLLTQSPYLEAWDGVKHLISARKMKEGEPLRMIHHTANLPLDEDSDEEAYKWLDLFVRNVETTYEDQIVDY